MSPREEEFRRRFGADEAGFRPEKQGVGHEASGAARLASALDLLDRLGVPQGAPAIADEIGALHELARNFGRGDVVDDGIDQSIRLEALIVADGSRPASYIRNGQLEYPEALGPTGSSYAFDRTSFEMAIIATGRILAGRQFVGSGTFAVLEDADGNRIEGVITARHVAERIGPDRGDSAGAVAGTIDFIGEAGSVKTCLHRLDRIVACGPDHIGRSVRPDTWDYALIALGDAIDGAARPQPVSPCLSRRRLGKGEPIAVIGYPSRPPVLPSELLEGTIWHRLLGGLYNVKRFAPGFLLPLGDDAMLSAAPDGRMVFHDATTVGGASGGAVLTVGGGYGAIHLGGLGAVANAALALDSVAMRHGWRS